MAKKQKSAPVERVTLVHSTRGTRITVAKSMAPRMLGYVPVGKTASPQGDPDESWTLAQLNEYAAGRNLDLGGATRKADVLDAILESQLDDEE
jgi:hypothetical protein